uniref:hypothetical protein n=1 Tax=Parerythrobacter lutipelagi TaxID=1964208 RepID=UPI0010F90B70|nr:hypothetical protein [Parerythrobacter lutipelagi]
MKAFKIIAGAFAGLWLITVVLIGAGGTWLTNNTDVVAEAAVEASGIKEQVAKAEAERCRAAEEQFSMAWNRAVDSNRLDQMEDSLRQMESQVKAMCAGL